jgi:pyrroloquinoline quinone (PQQ) biosynthesis protein C
VTPAFGAGLAGPSEVDLMSNTREFRDIRRPGAGAEAKSVDDFMTELGTLQSEMATAKNMVWEAVADGSLSEDYLKRLAKEYYFLGRYYTTELGSIVSNTPDVDELSLSTSEHFHHWLRKLAGETGYTGDANHVDLKIEWAHQLGITDAELVDYVAMPETIGAVFTTLYYMRRSYEEGLAAFGWAGERLAASTGYAKKMYEAMRDHYGIEVENFRVHAYAEADHGEPADHLLRQVAVSADQQRRIRRSIVHTFSVRNQRTVALNGWLDEPGALRRRGRG